MAVFCTVPMDFDFFCEARRPFSVPFYFTYEPANITNRVSNQSSIFLYQLYGINEIRQEIQPDFRLKISNKTEILKSWIVSESTSSLFLTITITLRLTSRKKIFEAFRMKERRRF